MRPIPLSRPNLTDAEREAAWAVLASDQISLGPATATLEQAVETYLNVPHVLSLSSATAGLHLGVRALRLRRPQPDRPYVALPSLTFVATAHALLYEGLIPLFVDIDPATGLMDMDALAAVLGRFPVQGIMPVDYAGRGLDARAIAQLQALAQPHGCWILEDASHGIAGRDGTGAPIGACSYADVAVLSLHATKNWTAAGEGGILATKDSDIAAFVRRHRAHGIRRGADRIVDDVARPWRYEVDYPAGLPGLNYRMADVQAAVAAVQLTRIEAIRAARQARAAHYDAALAGLTHIRPLPLDPPTPGVHARHLYVVQSAHRDALYRYLAAQQIQSQVHYTPVHHYLPAERYAAGPLPATEAFASTCLTLPCFELLEPDDQARVVEVLCAWDADPQA